MLKSLSLELQQVRARKWVVLACILGLLFLVGTGVYVTGALFRPTLQVEEWLLLRPETRADCVLVEWRNLGEIPAALILTGSLGIACLLAGYRRRVLLLLLLLLLIGIAIEGTSKLFIGAPLSPTLRSAMTNLTCPQFNGKPELLKLEVGLGMLNKVAPQSQKLISWSHDVAAMPIDLATTAREHSYPSGHAVRWSFIWFLAAWLFAHHLKPRPLGWLLAICCFIFAFMGGFIQFYTGVHFISDMLAGYLLGGALACVGIILLLLNGPRRSVLRPVANDQGSDGVAREISGIASTAPGTPR